jgi:xylan 1,4-beta-xylosidase
MKKLFFFVLCFVTLSLTAQNTAFFGYATYWPQEAKTPKGFNPAKKYLNPIMDGFYPDPSVCRKGNVFYLVHSSFAYYPGIPIFTSQDLVHWTQIGHVLDRPSQLKLDKSPISGGIYAPTIRYNERNETFYLITTCLNGIGNFIVKTKDPAKGWSDPIRLASVGGIDPSLFFDDNGKAYIVNNDVPEGNPLWEGHRALWIREYDLENDCVTGTSKMIVNGGVDPALKPVWIEGPHLFRRNGKYLLIAAEGGTGENHSEVAFTSDSIWGPYIPCSINPILTQRDLPANRKNAVTSTGHADLVDDAKGQTWAVFLGCQPYEGNLYNTGRETFLLPVKWKKEVPVILPKGKPVPRMVSKQGLEIRANESGGLFAFKDTLAPDWLMIRTPQSIWYRFRGKKLEVKLLPVSISDKAQPAFLGLRQRDMAFTFSTVLEFHPKNENELAGVVCFQNEDFHFIFGKTMEDGHEVLILDRKAGQTTRIASASLSELPEDAPLFLKVCGDGRWYSFWYVTDDKDWKLLADHVDGSNLSTEIAGGFTGALIGPYATSAAHRK